jgi:hypothetical protein
MHPVDRSGRSVTPFNSAFVEKINIPRYVTLALNLFQRVILKELLPFSLSTTWRTSAKHHLPFGFLLAQSQPPTFFSAAIFSMINDRPVLMKSCSISFTVYPKQWHIKSSVFIFVAPWVGCLALKIYCLKIRRPKQLRRFPLNKAICIPRAR